MLTRTSHRRPPAAADMGTAARPYQRAFDIAIAAALLLFWTPTLLLLLAYARIAYGRSGLIKVQVLGKGQRGFSRVMLMPDLAELAICRDTGLCLAPGAFNVLAGEMSMVGPVAVDAEREAVLRSVAPEFARRYKVRPGLIGPYDGTINLLTVRTAAKSEADYIQNWSLLGDLRLMASRLVAFGQIASREE